MTFRKINFLKIIVIACSVVLAVPLGILVTQAFIGPSTPPGVGGGILKTDLNGNLIIGSETSRIIFGSSTIPSNTRVTINSQINDVNPYVFKITDERWVGYPSENAFTVNRGGTSANDTYIGFSFGTTTHPGNLTGGFAMYTDPFTTIDPNTPRVYVRGRLLADTIRAQNIYASGTIIVDGGASFTTTAGNISAGNFGSATGLGHYSFPNNLGISTSTNIGLPQALSVYGSGYFTGKLGLGTSTAQNLTAPIAIRSYEPTGFNPQSMGGLAAFQDPVSGIHRYSLNLNNEGNLYFYGPSSIFSPLVIYQNGAVGINTIFTGSPSDTFKVGGNSKFSGSVVVESGSLSVGNITYQTSTLFVASTSSLAVYSGNVGIGKSNPSYKLDVVGDVNITGQYRVNGSPYSSGVNGTGTIGFIPRWNSASSITTSSAIYDDGFGNIGFGNTNPGAPLDISQTNQTVAPLRIRSWTTPGSIMIFSVRGSASANGTTVCRDTTLGGFAGSICLAMWDSVGNPSTCASTISNARVLCADFGS